MSANDGAALQGATSQSSTYSYTRLDDDDNGDDHRDTNASYIVGRDMQHILEVMEKAAYLAGEITRTTSGRIAVQMTKANERDLVTQSDLQCQRLIREVLSKEFPGVVFLGEEAEDDEGDDTVTTQTTIPSSDVLKNSLNNIGQQEDGGNEGRLLFVVVRVQLLLLCIDRKRKSHVFSFFSSLSSPL